MGAHAHTNTLTAHTHIHSQNTQDGPGGPRPTSALPPPGSKPGSYVPPSLRNRGTGERMADDAGGRDRCVCVPHAVGV